MQPLSEDSFKYNTKVRSTLSFEQGDDSARSIDAGNCKISMNNRRPIFDAQSSVGCR